jgi:hypothetical protein
MKLLKKMEKFKLAEPLFEAVRVVLTYRGEKYSPAYIQGISGAAFRTGGICPCAPTCTYAMWTTELPVILGYNIEKYEFLDDKGVDPDRWKDMVERIKQEIDNDRPVVMWSQFAFAEWCVINGYDDEKQVFIGCDSNHERKSFVKTSYDKASKLDVPVFGACIIGEKTAEPNLKELEIASLKEAVKHARTITEINPDPKKWTFLNGIQAYERWRDSFKDNPGRKKALGDSYCFRIYYNTHMAAHDYLIEIAPKYKSAEEELKKAAECFKKEREVFKGAWKIIGFSAPEEISEEGMLNAYESISKACAFYTEGIDWIDKAVKLL